jgi:quinol monooxygenase YgiN
MVYVAGKAFTMQVTLSIRPELHEEYLTALREVLVSARQEPACIFLYASEPAGEHGTIILFERWRDPDEYVNEILHRDYFQRYLRLSEPAYAAPRVVVRLDPIEPPEQCDQGITHPG